MSARSQPTPRQRDQGTVLLLTLILTVVLSVVVVALAAYAATGLRTSRVTTERTANRADVVATVHYVAEQLALGAAPCSVNNVPDTFSPMAEEISITCEQLPTLEGSPPTIRLAVSARSTAVTALLQVRREAIDPDTGRHPVVVLQWTDTRDVS